MDGEPDVPDCRPSPMQGSAVTPAFDERRRRLHIDHLGGARIADWPGAPHEQDRVFVDAECGIVDAPMIILRSIEYRCAALKRIRILRVAQITLAEFVGDHAGFHDRGIEQIAVQDLEAGLRPSRADHTAG